jgi:hypothetical protein
MDPSQILVKTTKGQEEVKSRASHMPQPVRMLLIMIDGHTSLESFKQKTAQLPHAKENLDWLVSEGFVELLADPAVVSGFSASVLSEHSGPTSAQKHALIELSHKLLGAHAAKVVQRLEESADTPQELQAALDRCHKLIKLTIDESKANRFLKTGQEILGKTTG